MYQPRELTFAGLRPAADRTLKTYELVAPGEAIDDGLRAAAWAQLPALVADRLDEETPAGGWCLLHRGGDAAYVVTYSWVWREVLEVRLAVAGCTALGAGGAEMTDFGVLDRPWAGCVWELAPLAHERASWIRHVLDPSEPDLEGYLSDACPNGRY